MTRITLIACTAAALWLAGCSMTPSERRIYDADEEFSKLDTPKVETVEESMKKSADHALETGEDERAVSLYKQLYDRNPDNLEYQLGFAESLRRAGEHAAAKDIYRSILRTHPNNMMAKEGQALAVMASGNTEESGQLFKQVMEQDNTRWRTLNALGILFILKDMPTESLAYFNEALKYSPNNPSVLNNIGLVQAMQRAYGQAVSTLREAAQEAKGNQRRHIEMNLALVHGISGNSDAARRVAEKHLSPAALTNNMGLYAYLADDEELAKSYLNMALTGSTVYYERAWENLEIIARQSRGLKDMTPEQKSIKIGDPVDTLGDQVESN